MLIHYYYGNGKGKTSAAVGAAIRMLGHKKQVLFVQFMKARLSGEVAFLAECPNAAVYRGRAGFGMPSRMSEEERAQTRAIHDKHLAAAIKRAERGECGMLVLDEVEDAASSGLLDAALLFGFLRRMPEHLEVVMTGHRPCSEFLEISDYATHMHKEKHPYDRGIPARKAVEY